MREWKKILALLVILTMLFGAVACSGGTEAETPSMDLTDGEEVVAGSLDELVGDYFANMPDHIYKIGQQDFIDLVAAGESMTILDIRSADDYAKGHIVGAVNMPWGPAISDGLSKIPSDLPLMVYCYTGQTAGQAVHTLVMAGFDARSVNLGYNFGISKVEGVDEYVVTDASELTEDVTTIDATIQAALDDYYGGLAALAGTTYANYKISEADLMAKMEAGDDFYLLSIRSKEDYDKGHIEGAENLPWGKDMAQGFSSLPKDKDIVVYCYSGQTAGQTVAALRLLGYNAVSLNGGIGVASNAPIGWINQGFETTALTTSIYAYFEEMPEHVYKIGEKDFVEMVRNGEEMTILDIRSAEDYAKGHIVGALNAPWGPSAIPASLSKIPSDKPLFVYCYSGQTAGQAVHTLNLAGFNARSVNLGFSLGIAKVEGVEEFVTTEAVSWGDDVTVIDSSVQFALDTYYGGLADVAGTTYASYKISEDDLNAKIEAGEDFYLLSIRAEKDYTEGHIEGAVNLPWGKTMAAGFGDLPEDQLIVVYCYTGQTAGQTVAALRLLGYDAVSLNGGAGMPSNVPHGWTNHGYTLVK